MRNPTPIDQLPRFLERSKSANEQGFTKWLPYIIVGGLVLAALHMAYRLYNTPVLNENQALPNE
jgi:leucyl-tRNA synthetase